MSFDWFDFTHHRFAQDKQRGFAPILIVILIAAAALGGGYLVYTTKNSNPPNPSNPPKTACTQEAKICPDGTSVGRTGPNCEFAPCPTPESTSSADLSTWKTYADNKNNFSFKYPKTWEMEQEGTTTRVFDPKSRYSPSFSHVSYSFFRNTDIVNIEDYVEQLLKTYPTLQFTSITVGGLEGKRTTGIPSADLNDNVFVKRGDTIFNIELANEGASITKETFDQILSTFKFLDQNALDQSNGDCQPRPACLDATTTPRCLMPEPAEGWCP